jgi:hypothetical protein
MIWSVVVVLLLLWVLGLATQIAGSFIHTLLVFAAIVAIVHLAKGGSKRLVAKSAPLFLTEFEVYPTWDFPKDFALKNWTGLLLCQVIDRGTTDARLLAWWDSPASYGAYWASRFKAELMLNDPVFQGVMVRHKREEETWWKKLKKPAVIYSVFVSFVAVLTNITQLTNFKDWALATPEMELLPPKEPEFIVVGEPYTLTINANNHTHSDCEVLLTVPNVKPDKGLAIGEDQPVSRNLAAGGSMDIVYHLNARTAGQYELRFSGTQHSGQWRGWLPLPEHRCKVEVWSAVDPNPRVDFRWLVPDGSAAFLVTARHGHPPGSPIRYQAVLNGDDLSFVDVSPGKIIHNTHSGGVAVLVWQAAARPTRQPQEFEVRVKRETGTDENYWKKLATEFHVNAQYVETQ